MFYFAPIDLKPFFRASPRRDTRARGSPGLLLKKRMSAAASIPKNLVATGFCVLFFYVDFKYRHRIMITAQVQVRKPVPQFEF